MSCSRSRATYYQRLGGTPSPRQLSDVELTDEIRDLHDESAAPTGR